MLGLQIWLVDNVYIFPLNIIVFAGSSVSSIEFAGNVRGVDRGAKFIING